MLKRVRATKHPWLVACDVKMSPVDFEKSLWFQKGQMHVIAPQRASTVTAGNSLKGKISQMNVVEDFESRPHKADSFVVERGTEIQKWN